VKGFAVVAPGLPAMLAGGITLLINALRQK